MASAARQVIEDMVPELQSLEEKGYFSREEIRNVIRKREDFELRIRRKAAVKADFLRYIDFERSLEHLRVLRKKARNISSSDSKADHCIVRRTHFVYERMLRKFRGDISLWSRWLDFCRQSGSGRQMSRVLTRALQLHPTYAPLWAYTAAWEFENNNNAAAARALMQTGLRMCRSSPELWHEYFKLEVLYAHRLWARREVLGLKHVRDKGDEDMSAKAAEQVMKGGVARIVYKNAIATISDDVKFRMKFIDVLRPIDLPGKNDLMELIYNDVVTSFADSAEAYQLQVQRCRAAESQPLAAFLAGLEKFVEGLNESHSVGLVQAFQNYLWAEIGQLIDSQLKEDALSATQAALQAITTLSPSASLLHTASCIKLKLGDVAGALECAEAAYKADPSNSTASVRQVAAIAACSTAVAQAPMQLGYECKPETLAEAHPSLGGPLPEVWLCLLRVAVTYQLPLEPLAHVFRGHYLDQGVGTAELHQWPFIASRFVHAAYATGGSASARSIWKLMEGTQLEKSTIAELLK